MVSVEVQGLADHKRFLATPGDAMLFGLVSAL